MKIFLNMCMGLGDSVYLIPPVCSLIKHYPDMKITIFGWDSVISLFSGISGIDKIISASDFINTRHLDEIDSSQRAQEIANIANGYDYFIDFQKTLESATIAKLSEAQCKIGADPSEEGKDWYTRTFLSKQKESISDFFGRIFCEVFDLQSMDFIQHVLNIGKHLMVVEKELAKKNSTEERIIGIHPGAKAEEKLWNNKKWSELANWAIDEISCKVILFGSSLIRAGGTVINDISNTNFINRFTKNRCLNLCAKTKDISLLSAFISKCDLYIGLDTGPTHLANFLGTRTLELFKIVDEDQFERWKIKGPNAKVIAKHNLSECTVSEVKKAVFEMLQIN